jgi:RND family efflux transporter MFP subunit
VLATLDNEVHETALAIARKSMEAQGGLNAALAEVQLRKDRLEKFEALRAKDHARQEEVDRARAELAMAEARLLAVREELQIKKLEYEKIKAQIERRTIRAPLDGVVTRLHKDEGEFVAANDPNVVTVVQLKQLLATFSVPAARARDMRVGEKVRLDFSEGQPTAEGAVEFIAPVIDAESGTVRVKVRLENSSGACRSGERCTLNLSPGSRQRSTPAAATSGSPTRAAQAPSHVLRGGTAR